MMMRRKSDISRRRIKYEYEYKYEKNQVQLCLSDRLLVRARFPSGSGGASTIGSSFRRRAEGVDVVVVGWLRTIRGRRPIVDRLFRDEIHLVVGRGRRKVNRR